MSDDRGIGEKAFDEVTPILRDVPNWAPGKCFAGEREQRLLARHAGELQEDILPRALRSLGNAKAKLEKAAAKVDPVKRLAEGSDDGTGIKGARHCRSALKEYFEASSIAASYQRRFNLCKQGLEVLTKHLELSQVEDAGKEERLTKQNAMALTKQYKKHCKNLPTETSEIVRQVMDNPMSTNANIILLPAMSFIIGRALKQLHVLRRYLEEIEGVKGLPEPPKVKVPKGFAENLERILGRKLYREEKLQGLSGSARRINVRKLFVHTRGRELGPTEVLPHPRHMDWHKVTQMFAQMDARLRLEALEAAEAAESE